MGLLEESCHWAFPDSFFRHGTTVGSDREVAITLCVRTGEKLVHSMQKYCDELIIHRNIFLLK